MATTEPILERELATYLNAQGFGNLATGEIQPFKIFTGEVPDDQPDCVLIVIQENGGAPPPQKVSEERNVTILVYDADFVAGRTTMQQIHRILHENQGILEPAILVARITADTNPIPLGRDSNRRHVFSQSFTFLTRVFEPT